MERSFGKMQWKLLQCHKLLTPTLHKILAFGGDLIEYQSLLVGDLSEEAQESKNKE